MRIGASIIGAEQRLLNAMADANAATLLHAIRLATGAKVSQPSQDPAAFVQIANLESRLNQYDSTLNNVQNASNVVAQTQLVLDQIRSQFDTIRSALEEDEDLELTDDERAEKQVEIDEAIAAINSLATSSIEGRRRLDGSANFRYTGLDSNQIRELRVYSTRETTIRGEVTTKATRAELTYTGAAGLVTDDGVFELTGALGAVSFEVSQNDDLDDVAESINQQSHKTGITAAVSGNELSFKTVRYGSNATIAISVSSGAFAVAGGNGDGTAEGIDAVARINDETLTGNGNRFTYNRNGLRFTLEFEGAFRGGFSPITVESDSVQRFALSAEPGELTSLALPGLQAAQFRGLSGSLDQLLSGGDLEGLGANTSQAIRVVDEGLARLSLIEGAVNGFADQTIASSANLLDGMSTSIEDTLSAINGINEDEESLLISRNQQLADNVLTSLAIFNNQRASIVSLLQQLAGL